MKSIIINGVEYCKYETHGSIIYLNCDEKMEEAMVRVISIIENRGFTTVAYLNI